MAWFVWIQGRRGPVPQIWHTPQIQGETGKSYPTLAKLDLIPGTEDQPGALDTLIKLYPPPEIPNGQKVNIQSEP